MLTRKDGGREVSALSYADQIFTELEIAPATNPSGDDAYSLHLAWLRDALNSGDWQYYQGPLDGPTRCEILSRDGRDSSPALNSMSNAK
jgi:hypothetical protein